MTVKTKILHDEVLGMSRAERSHLIGKSEWRTLLNMRVDSNRLIQVPRKGFLTTLGSVALSCPVFADLLLTEDEDSILTESGLPILVE